MRRDTGARTERAIRRAIFSSSSNRSPRWSASALRLSLLFEASSSSSSRTRRWIQWRRRRRRHPFRRPLSCSAMMPFLTPFVGGVGEWRRRKEFLKKKREKIKKKSKKIPPKEEERETIDSLSLSLSLRGNNTKNLNEKKKKKKKYF